MESVWIVGWIGQNGIPIFLSVLQVFVTLLWQGHSTDQDPHFMIRRILVWHAKYKWKNRPWSFQLPADQSQMKGELLYPPKCV